MATYDTELDSAHRWRSDVVRTCPECSVNLAFMGRNFRPPRKLDNRKWSLTKELWEFGFRFIGSGAHNGEPIPQTKTGLDDFLKRNQKHPQRVDVQLKWNKYKLEKHLLTPYNKS